MTESSLQGPAVVTGAASGIGLATAAALARAGAAVALADQDADAGMAAAAGLQSQGHNVRFQQVDVADSASVERLFSATVESFGPPRILVNNAGLQRMAPIEDFEEQQWRLLIDVMLVGTFLCTREMLRRLRGHPGGGRIVNMASIHALVASPFKSAYVAAKHGVLGFTRAAALETADRAITVNAVCPSYVRTPLVEKQIADQARLHSISPEEVVRQVMLRDAPIKRLLEPDEVAALVLYLCSPAAAGITGSVLPIDCGWTAH